MRKLLMLCCLLLPLAVTGAGPAAAASTTRASTASGNVYMAGGDVRVLAPVTADLATAGGRVSVEREVAADAALAGGAVDVLAAVGQDLRVAAGTVNIKNEVGADLVAVGGMVTVDPTARVGGSAWLAGSELNVGGTLQNGARIYGNTITVSGQINGNAVIAGEQIVFAPGARINGNLSYASPVALSDAQRAQVSGTVTRLETPQGWKTGAGTASRFPWFHLVFVLSMLVFGMALYLLFPRAVGGAEDAIGRYPGRSLLTGLALLFSVPPVAILFMITVVGIPLGLALLLLYPLALLLGYLGTAFFLSRKAAAAMKQSTPLGPAKQSLFLVLALIVLSLALAVPFLGFFVLLLAVVAGTGGWAVWLLHKHRQPEPGT